MHLRWIESGYRIEWDAGANKRITSYTLQYSNDNGATWHDVPAFKRRDNGEEVKVDHAPQFDVPARY